MHAAEWRRNCKKGAVIGACLFGIVFMLLVILSIFLMASARSSELVKFAIVTAFEFLLMATFFFSVAHRLDDIETSEDQPENFQCYRGPLTLMLSIVMHSDYYIPRCCIYCYTMFNFLGVIEMLKRTDLFSSDLQSENHQNTSYGVYALLVISIIALAIIIGIYLAVQLSQLILDYTEYQKQVVFSYFYYDALQEQTFRVRVIRKCFQFLIFLLILIIARAIYAIFALEMMSLISLVILVEVQNALLTWTILRLIFQLAEIQLYNRELDNVQIEINNNCFIGYYVLCTSIFRSATYKIQRRCLIISIIAHFMCGIVVMPFYNFSDYFKYTSYGVTQLIYGDTVLLQITFLYMILEDTMRRILGFMDISNIYHYADTQIMPQLFNVNQQSIDQYATVDQTYDCCICLDEITGYQKKRVLQCHPQHIFHYYCIQKWLVLNRNCPLCQQVI